MTQAKVTFADQYKAAGLNPTADIIRLRQGGFDTLRSAIDVERIFDLTRLYFGFSVPTGALWFRDGFAKADPSFSLIDNAREAAVLAYILLSAALADGKVVAGLAPLTTSAANARTPAVYPQYLVEAREQLAAQAIKARHREAEGTLKITAPVQKEAPGLAENDWTKAGEALKAINSNSVAAVTNLAKQTQAAVSTLSFELSTLREEAGMLWWYVGGWSRIYDKPFAGFEPALLAVLGGLDLAQLVRTTLGPVSVPAILHKLMYSSIHVHQPATKKRFVLSFPDLSGESYEQLLANRRCKPDYVSSQNGGGGLLLFLTANRRLDGLCITDIADTVEGAESVSEPDEVHEWTPNIVPEQVRLVELLQFLQRRPFDKT